MARQIANDEHLDDVRKNRGFDQSLLGMDWAIPIRNWRQLNDRQQMFY